MRLPFLIVLSSAIAGGCYHYVPADRHAPIDGAEVRFRLTSGGSEQLAAVLGGQTTMVSGRVLAIADTAVTIAVSSTRKESGIEVVWAGERVLIPRPAIEREERRRLDRRRTIYAIGGGVLAAVAGGLLIGTLGTSGGGSGDGPPPPPPP